MKKALLSIFLLAFQIALFARTADTLLVKLDRAIAQRAEYAQIKEEKIDNLKHLFQNTDDREAKFNLLGQIFEQYLPYNTDSALSYTQKRIVLAQEMAEVQYIAESKTNLAAIKNNAGMYSEALAILNSIKPSFLSNELQLYRYKIYRAIYGSMQDYAIANQERQIYLNMTNSYRDSIILLAESGTKDYIYAQSDKQIITGQCKEAVDLLTNYYNTIKTDNHDKAIVAYNLSQAWLCLGNEKKALEYLTISAICDIKESVKEYISLWQLATMVYQQGDIDRAYNYLKLSLQDASHSKARLRTLKINEIFPVIEQAYQKNKEEQQHNILIMMAIISIMALFLLLAMIVMRQQLIRLRRAKNELSDANTQLQQLNMELAQYNSRIRETNNALTETISIKEEYIGRYMDLCSHYIDRMDEYRRSMYKKASMGRAEELIAELKSSLFIKNELKEFYSSFDHTFLRLFPTFIDEFNALLADNEQVTLKSNELLNTELRVFALIRLGITDSEKIAGFLRYSITTIYNYRTRMRNKARGNRQDFDANVMKIGMIRKE